LVPPPKEVKETVKKEDKEPIKKEDKEPVKKEDKQKEDKKASKVEENKVPLTLRTNWLKQIGLAYHTCLDLNKKPPAKVEDLAVFYDNDAKISAALKTGQ